MKPNAQRLRFVLCIIAIVGLMSAVGYENTPAENPDPKSTPMKLQTPLPQVKPGPPGQNAKVP